MPLFTGSTGVPNAKKRLKVLLKTQKSGPRKMRAKEVKKSLF